MEPTKTFATEQEAMSWMVDQVDDPCIDWYRFAYMDDPEGMATYDSIAAEGCCGSFDAEVTVSGRRAMVGCNYGH